MLKFSSSIFQGQNCPIMRLYFFVSRSFLEQLTHTNFVSLQFCLVTQNSMLNIAQSLSTQEKQKIGYGFQPQNWTINPFKVNESIGDYTLKRLCMSAIFFFLNLVPILLPTKIPPVSLILYNQHLLCLTLHFVLQSVIFLDN